MASMARERTAQIGGSTNIDAHALVLVALLQGLHIGEDIRPLPRRFQAGETRRGPFNKSLGIC